MQRLREACVKKQPLQPRVVLTLRCSAPVPWDGPLVAQGVIVLRNLRHDAKRKSRLSALMCLLPAASYPGAGERDRL